MVYVLKYLGIGTVVLLLAFLFLFREKEKTLTKFTDTPQEISSPATTTAVETPQVKKEVIITPPLPQIDLPEIKAATTTPVSPPPPPPLSPPSQTRPPLDEESILRSVVKIECPTEDDLGKYVGSGFALAGDIIVTAAHVVKDSGQDTCTVIFPKDRRPIYYLRGTIDNLKEVVRRHDEEGIDVAVLRIPSLVSYEEARAIFSEYPAVPYPVCENPAIMGDKLLHFGYPSNYLDQNYLSRLEGEAVAYADINGIKEQLSQDQTYTYKTPIFSYNADESRMHPYMVSRVASFYGDSGGLAFNATKQCILGPHRGGTIGKSSGENFSIFMVLGWEKARGLLAK